MATALDKLGRYEEATAAYDRVLQIRPELTSLPDGLGDALSGGTAQDGENKLKSFLRQGHLWAGDT
jgi:cytochrome c-type biogenesis protein CcmH/NrfG